MFLHKIAGWLLLRLKKLLTLTVVIKLLLKKGVFFFKNYVGLVMEKLVWVMAPLAKTLIQNRKILDWKASKISLTGSYIGKYRTGRG